MFIELIATFVAGFACAGIALTVNKVTGGRLPRWLTPVAAGAGMIAMIIYNEYTWFERTEQNLPQGLEIALKVDEKSWLRPWTQIWPYTKRFVAVDTATARRNEAAPGQKMADLYFFGRWSPVNQVPVLFDCSNSRSAILIDGAEFGDDGTVGNADWQAMPKGDPVFRLACEQEG